jgi:hypothetical protein
LTVFETWHLGYGERGGEELGETHEDEGAEDAHDEDGKGEIESFRYL